MDGAQASSSPARKQSARARAKPRTLLSNSVSLGKIKGIEIGIHYTWLLALVLISWSLAAGFFPTYFPGWTQAAYWTTGIIAAIFLFISVLIHELAHSFVAQARGLPVHSITLFIFGGVSNITGELKKAKDEFVMSIVGPLTSLVLAGLFWIIQIMIRMPGTPISAMFGYLALINGLLAVFNLLPGFPLDGGRVLRSIIWSVTGNLTRATNIAATAGHALAWVLIVLGFLQLLAGNFLGGLWIAFIGWFLNGAAETSRLEVTSHERLKGFRVSDVMSRDVETVSPETTVDNLVSDNFLGKGRRAAPVKEDGKVVGIVTLADVKELPKEKWSQVPVEQIMTAAPLYTVDSEADLDKVLQMLAENDINQVLVADGGKLKGMIGRSDIMQYLRASEELGLFKNK
jgi:Zn-dependent protease/CBS domain-containing protein